VLEFVHSYSVSWDPEQLRASVQNRAVYLKTKRIADLSIVLLSLPITLFILLFAAAASAILTGRPVFIAQDRVGLHGRVFRLWKLRTMRHQTDDGRPTAVNDSRITSLGRFLRRSHLDELPQLWNVVVGDMSLIGPRPEQAFLVSQYGQALENYELRHIVRPGLSGLAQVYYGYAENLSETSEKLKFDLFYVQHIGLRMDVQILVRTLLVFMNPLYVR
jgi:lipopolysaccharide/colanic/teichoic acid biosynthesis glycosyltransferase